MEHNQVLDEALRTFKQGTGYEFRLVGEGRTIDGALVDAVLELGGVRYLAEVKKWAQQANFGALVHQIQQLPGRGILIADFVNRKMAKRLAEAEVPFLDTAGNAYLKQPPIYINIRGNEPRPRPTGRITLQQGPGRAFTPTGLKVVYQFLITPDLIRQPYRDIAEAADVALGTVGWVLNDLRSNGLVVGHKKKTKVLDYRRLLIQWCGAYAQKLRPKLHRGNFMSEDPYWWENFDPLGVDAQWGGEVAATRLVGYLKPAVATLYFRGELATLVRGAHLRKAGDATRARVEILHPFWKQEEKLTQTVKPALVYADLVRTGDPRNLETAELVYEQKIDRHIGEA